MGVILSSRGSYYLRVGHIIFAWVILSTRGSYYLLILILKATYSILEGRITSVLTGAPNYCNCCITRQELKLSPRHNKLVQGKDYKSLHRIDEPRIEVIAKAPPKSTN